MLKLSVIIPVYNAGEDLKKCLDSVLSQTINDFELILVDDGSTDGSEQICDDYALIDDRIKVIHQSNGGQAHARNVGIDLAQGEYIGFVDNDDTVVPNMFEILLNNAIVNSYDISAASFKELKDDGTYVSKQHDSIVMILSNDEGIHQILLRNKLDIYVWTKIYKRSFLTKHCIRFERGKNDEDFLFNFAAYAKASSSIFVDIALYVYHYKRDSETRRIRKDRINDYLVGTWYRVNKIVEQTNLLYPKYVLLAERQKMLYYFQMIDAILKSELLPNNRYYKDVMCYFHHNRKIVYNNRDAIGLHFIGIFCLLSFSPCLYFYYKKYKNKIGYLFSSNI